MASRASRTRSPLRVFYAAGPGDVIGTFRHWRAGRDDPREVAQTYSGQFFDACRELGCRAHVVAAHPTRGRVEDGAFRVEHRPDPSVGARGVRYHLLSACYLLGLMISALRFRADAMVVGNVSHWFLLGLLPPLGVRVVPTLHCTLWPKYREPRGFLALLRWLNGRFFRRSAAAILCVSDDIARQVRVAAGGRAAPTFVFTPTYRPETFDVAPPPPSPPFRVCFAGRIERNKGVFDLLEICQRFVSAGRYDIEFDLCGRGGAEEELRRRVGQAGLADRFRLHGQLDRGSLVKIYQKSHVIMVPTTADFVEGFNKVVAEGILSGRPVITSDVCPAVEYLRGAAVTVPHDDARAYGDAILKMAEDPGYYRERCRACRDVEGRFFDRSRGWRAAFERALSASGLTPQSDCGGEVPAAALGAYDS